MTELPVKETEHSDLHFLRAFPVTVVKDES